VTEPAVSVAVAALRRELGDELFVRDGRGIALTAGGRRLAALASEILGLADQARRSVQDSPGQARLMQVAVTNVVAEYVGPLIDAFTARDPGLEVAIDTVAGASMAELLQHRRADIALGPPPSAERAATIATVPFLRCRLVVVAAPGHRLAGRQDIPLAELAGDAGWARPSSTPRRAPGCCSRAPGWSRPTSWATPRTPRRWRPRPPATASCSRWPTR
jgi:DNA-binding transcriptional LysR family regulator